MFFAERKKKKKVKRLVATAVVLCYINKIELNRISTLKMTAAVAHLQQWVVY